MQNYNITTKINVILINVTIISLSSPFLESIPQSSSVSQSGGVMQLHNVSSNANQTLSLVLVNALVQNHFRHVKSHHRVSAQRSHMRSHHRQYLRDETVNETTDASRFANRSAFPNKEEIQVSHVFIHPCTWYESHWSNIHAVSAARERLQRIFQLNVRNKQNLPLPLTGRGNLNFPAFIAAVGVGVAGCLLRYLFVGSEV